nr:hypothetical protein [Tanacetum cinerariifolium]
TVSDCLPVHALMESILEEKMSWIKPKSTSKSDQSEETIFKAIDTEMPLNQGDNTGNTDAQPDDEAITKDDWFKKPARPHTLDPKLIQGKSVNSKPTQTWLNDLPNA